MISIRIGSLGRGCPCGGNGRRHSPTAFVLWLAIALFGCGKDEPLSMVATGGQARTPAGDALEVGASSNDRAEPAPAATATAGDGSALSPQALPPAVAPAAECTAAADCAYETLGELSGQADCACARCPAEVGAVPRAVLEARRASFREYCRDWVKSNPCPPQLCAEPAALICEKGACDVQE